ncbi:hypothetical protein BR93DRAFT_302262 [Coniochaeta sp. PMI_546]|nr:hypothetical protein BR93DRAFT_302262 [Coniochaeta sp. PMI_546]
MARTFDCLGILFCFYTFSLSLSLSLFLFRIWLAISMYGNIPLSQIGICKRAYLFIASLFLLKSWVMVDGSALGGRVQYRAVVCFCMAFAVLMTQWQPNPRVYMWC